MKVEVLRGWQDGTDGTGGMGIIRVKPRYYDVKCFTTILQLVN